MKQIITKYILSTHIAVFCKLCENSFLDANFLVSSERTSILMGDPNRFFHDATAHKCRSNRRILNSTQINNKTKHVFDQNCLLFRTKSKYK